MTDDTNSKSGELMFTDNGHIAGFGNGPQTTAHSETVPTVSATHTPLTVTSNTAGLDEPEPSLRNTDELDGWGGPEPKSETDHVSNDDSQDERPDLPLPESVEWWLPDDSDHDGRGRIGLLSTYTEVHALVLGLTAGAHFVLSGDAQLINDVLGIAIAGDRVRRARLFSETYREQATAELPYFVAGVAIGYGLARSNVFAGLGV